MRYDLGFSLSSTEVCRSPGIYFAKTYVAVPSGQPEARKITVGKRAPDLTKLGSLTDLILNKLTKAERPRIVGYSILKLCAAHDPISLERAGNYVFAKHGAEAYDVEHLTSVTDEGICAATIFNGTGKVLNCVDFPHTPNEDGLYGTQVVEAVSTTVLHKANIIMRPNVHSVTDKDLAQ